MACMLARALLFYSAMPGSEQTLRKRSNPSKVMCTQTVAINMVPDRSLRIRNLNVKLPRCVLNIKSTPGAGEVYFAGPIDPGQQT